MRGGGAVSVGEEGASRGTTHSTRASVNSPCVWVFFVGRRWTPALEAPPAPPLKRLARTSKSSSLVQRRRLSA
eukprot:9252146-Pyramimonas_sp.AAC.1